MGGLDHPVLALVVPGSTDLAIVEQPGRIQVLRNGTLQPFLDVTDRTEDSGEQGLLGFAFHPAYASNGVAIVSYTDNAGDSVVSRFKRAPGSAGGGVLDPRSEEVLMRLDQPFANHNGGHVVYGPDGMLYVGFGDGGAVGDPAGHGQNRATWFGSILRLDVGETGPYAVPADNPFVGQQGVAPELWSYGWRNPWRFSFDPKTGDLWIADVGQAMYEEVNHEPAGTGGRNYGWNRYEGNHHYPSLGPVVVPLPGYTFPVAEYDHEAGCSVTGGPVYRGAALPWLDGHALYGDYCSGTIWSLAGPTAQPQVLLESSLTVSSFGTDAAGEVLVMDHSGGRILRLAACPSPCPG